MQRILDIDSIDLNLSLIFIHDFNNHNCDIKVFMHLRHQCNQNRRHHNLL